MPKTVHVTSPARWTPLVNGIVMPAFYSKIAANQCSPVKLSHRNEAPRLREALPQSRVRLGREGGRHVIWKNSANGKSAAVPRHVDVPPGTVRQICKDLEIEPPKGK